MPGMAVLRSCANVEALKVVSVTELDCYVQLMDKWSNVTEIAMPAGSQRVAVVD